MKQTLTVEIAGSKFRMVSDVGQERLERLAAEVNMRVEALGPKATKIASSAQLLAVVALGLVDDLENAERRRQRLESRTRHVVEQAIDQIDKTLSSSAASAA